jgi:hypothetical protein
MKKRQLISLLGWLTGIGVAMIAAGLFYLSQLSANAVDQTWGRLAEKHLVFVWAACIYCCVLMTLDLWVIAGMLTRASAEQNIRP